MFRDRGCEFLRTGLIIGCAIVTNSNRLFSQLEETTLSESQKPAHTPFHFGFVLASLAVALTVGFGYAAVLAVLIGFQWPMGNWWVAMLQAHGHAQLLGWIGLFIIGVSLYFLPRLAGTPLRHPRLPAWILSLLGTGIFLRAVSQPLLAAGLEEPIHTGLRWTLGFSACLETAGVFCYLFLLVGTLRGAAPDRPALQTVRIFLAIAVAGWGLYSLLAATLALQAGFGDNPLLHIAWNRFGIELFTGFVILPTAMAFSVRTFPLYLRLPAVRWPVARYGQVYLLALIVIHVPVLAQLTGMPFASSLAHLSPIGKILRGGILLLFIWKLDILFRWYPPWTVHRIGEPGPDRRPTRPGLPDYGEFGRFELLLYAAFVFLALAAAAELLDGALVLFRMASPFDPDALRHTHLAGFITLLLLGMAPRMVPGFLHKRRVAFPGLVVATFAFATAAALCRIAPLLLAEILHRVPGGLTVSMTAFGISGVLGWLAAAVLAYNLLQTWRNSTADTREP
ncbi:MAG: hypothetical protein OXR72_11170 [Gemmatimonadota bacterium]|nr:hypothetical protein [Gemmatimonadota bacterium]